MHRRMPIEASIERRVHCFRVAHIVAVIDRMEGARENIERAGIAFESLFTTADLGL